MTTTKTHVPKTLCFHGLSAWFMLIFLYVGGLVLCFWLIWKFKESLSYGKRNRIDGKVVIITGCNSGIGKETALELARRGGRIYMACRDATRCEAARLEIIERTGNQNVFNRTLNLASLVSVRNFAENFLAEEDRLDILINNAGIYGRERSLTVDGYEKQFAVNYLGHFLLTNLLLTRLKASAPSRIVVVSSIMYLFGRIQKDDLNSVQKYTNMGAYSQSKLANVLFIQKLTELLKDSSVTVNALHPGLVNTKMIRYNARPVWFWDFLYFLLRIVLKSPRAGAQTSIRLALDPALMDSSGGFYADTLRWPIMPCGRDKKIANWLWNECEKMVGLHLRKVKEDEGHTHNDDDADDEDVNSIVINNL